MLKAEGLALRLGGFALTADFDAPKGALVAVVGPSGGGKTSLLALIAGFVPAAGGRLEIDGRDVTEAPPRDRPVSMIFQDHNLFPRMSAAENVGLGLSPALRLSAEDRDRVARAMAEVGLEGLGDRRPAALSGGQRQRVALARALLRDRPALLLDEPFAALGPGLRRDMLALVDRLRREKALTVLLVTHDPAEARRCDLVIAVAEGRAGPAVAADALLDDPPPALRDWLG